MGRVIARTPAQVIAGEAVAGTRAQRYSDMLGIASVVANRAAVTGVTPQQVVGVNKQFNAYGKAMPAGTAALVGMAQDAINEVATKGPIHAGTFFATPERAAKIGVKGLQKVDETLGHQYFTDPKARAIQTAVGTVPADYSQLAAARAPQNIPTPTFAQRNIGGLLAPEAQMAMGLAPTPTASLAQAAISSALSPAQEANLAGRLGPSALSPAQEQNLASRLGPASASTLSPAQEANLASRLGPTQAPTRTALSPAQERNLASRFGDMDAATAANVAGRLDAAQAPAPSMSIGGLLGVSPASAGTLTGASPAVASAPQAAPVSTGFAGPIGSPRSMEATIAGPTAGARYASAPTSMAAADAKAVASRPAFGAPPASTTPDTATTSLASAPSPAPASTNFAGIAGSPRAAEEQSMASLNAADALGAGMFSASTPKMSAEDALAADVADQRKAMGLPALSAPQTIAAPPATYNTPMAAQAPAAPAPAYANSFAPEAPQSIEGVVGQNRQATGLGQPNVPSAPSPFSQATANIGNSLTQNAGRTLGGLLGAAALGPVGGLLGGLAGQAIQKGNTVQASPTAQALGRAGLIGGLVDGGIGTQQTGGLLGGLFSGLSGLFGGTTTSNGNGFSDSVNNAARNEGFDGFGYSGTVGRNTSSGGRGGGIGPGGSGARDPSS